MEVGCTGKLYLMASSCKPTKKNKKKKKRTSMALDKGFVVKLRVVIRNNNSNKSKWIRKE